MIITIQFFRISIPQPQLTPTPPKTVFFKGLVPSLNGGSYYLAFDCNPLCTNML